MLAAGSESRCREFGRDLGRVLSRGTVIVIRALIVANDADAKCYSYKDLAYVRCGLGRGCPCPNLVDLPGHPFFQAR